MKICPKCDAENPIEAKFCNLCFESFQAASVEGGITSATGDGEGEPGASAKCPNCGEIGPALADFCGRCGFAFAGTERQVVEPGQQQSDAQAKLDEMERETQELREKPFIVTAESDGADVMRRLSESLDAGFIPRVRATGKEPVTLAVKLLARLSEEFRAKEQQLWVQTHFVDGEPVRYLEEMQIEFVVVVSARAG